MIVHRVIGVDYSARPSVVSELRQRGVDVVVAGLPTIGAVLRESIDSATRASCVGNDRFVIHEVGGYCADLLRSDAGLLTDGCLGVVEETKQGLWRYQGLPELPVPVMQIADSRLKDLEGPYVGRSIVRVLLEDLKAIGRSPKGCNFGVLGAGVIGRAIIQELRRRRFAVWCWDESAVARIHAAEIGAAVVSRREVIGGADLLIGATGHQSLQPKDLRLLSNGVLLASASSREVELPVSFIRSHAVGRKAEAFVRGYRMPWKKLIHISGDGRPVNFRSSSLPPAIADLMFGQIARCILQLREKKMPRGLSSLPIRDQEALAESWLSIYGEPVRAAPSGIRGSHR